MTTRYSLPQGARQAHVARGARLLAALVLVTTVIALPLLIEIVPDVEADAAASPDAGVAPAPEPVVIGA